jgi:hypothetical protein
VRGPFDDERSNQPAPGGIPVTEGTKRCLHVIGMHRSGTSAVTGFITQLGLRGPAEEDVFPAGRWNAQGNKESASLTGFNEDILVSLGGGWSAPTVLEPHWEKGPAMVDRRAQASALLTQAFGSQPFVWKDPRNCLLLPFWQAITPPDAAVFVYRNPLEVAGSIRARNHFPLTHGLALWERYVRAAAANLEGIPTLVTGFDRVLGDTEAWCRELVDFLTTTGLPVDSGSLEAAVHSLDSGLRHQRPTPLPDDGIHASQRDVLSVLDGLQGTHLPWSAPDLGDEPDWVEDVLAMRRQYLTLRQQHQPSMSPLARAGRRLQRATRGHQS